MKLKIEVFDIGNTVICDDCGDDYTKNDVQGGILFGSKAYCPDCTKKALPRIARYGEDRFIKGKCPEGISFADWVRALRSGDNTIQIITEEADDVDQ